LETYLPHPLPIQAIRCVAGPAGVLLIVKNYTGDRLNFGLAAELARAEGLSVDMVVVADDVALAATQDPAGRRGIAGTVLVHKIAGACAAQGASLTAVSAAARAAMKAIATMGVALSACTVPAAGRPGFELGEQEIELGLGIHGEAGVSRSKMSSVDDLVENLLDAIVINLALRADEPVALLVNNLGATPAMEMALVARAAILGVRKRGLHLERVWSGTFLSALDMAGVSLSLIRLDAALLAGLDAPSSTSAWPSVAQDALNEQPPLKAISQIHTHAARSTLIHAQGFTTGSSNFQMGLSRALQALLSQEVWLTDLDQAVGDGDLGSSLARGCHAILRDLSADRGDNPALSLRQMAQTIRSVVGGTSGPLYSVGLMRAAQSIVEHNASEIQPLYPTQTTLVWANALRAAAQGIQEVGGASLGDRTMLDALIPAAESMRRSAELGLSLKPALELAYVAAGAGARATANLMPRRGRSSYLGERALGHPDPGAHAVAIWLGGLCA
jgi:triose/dihydroxyacetone kinase / FAD-AMP lyase (cyclizing)